LSKLSEFYDLTERIYAVQRQAEAVSRERDEVVYAMYLEMKDAKVRNYTQKLAESLNLNVSRVGQIIRRVRDRQLLEDSVTEKFNPSDHY
jgi:gamma-glutamyl phosphate reductase